MTWPQKTHKRTWPEFRSETDSGFGFLHMCFCVFAANEFSGHLFPHHRRRAAEDAPHLSRQVALMREAGRECHLRDREVWITQQVLRAFHAPAQHVLMD